PVLHRGKRRLAELERGFQAGDQLLLGIGPRHGATVRRLLAGRRPAEIVVPLPDQVGDHVAEAHLGGCGLAPVLVGRHFLRGRRNSAQESRARPGYIRRMRLSLVGALLCGLAARVAAQSNAARIANDAYTRSHDYDLVHQLIDVRDFDWDSTTFTGRVTTTLV